LFKTSTSANPTATWFSTFDLSLFLPFLSEYQIFLPFQRFQNYRLHTVQATKFGWYLFYYNNITAHKASINFRYFWNKEMWSFLHLLFFSNHYFTTLLLQLAHLLFFRFFKICFFSSKLFLFFICWGQF
jgi:hypothetical protein